jgi:hypothetical protein
MHRIALVMLFAVTACAEHGSGGGDGTRPPVPSSCGCVSETPVANFDDCCDSTTCFFDEETDAWEIHACDPPPPDPCGACGADTLCVQQYDGSCNQFTSCRPLTVACPENACSAECQAAYCGGEPFQCEVRPACGTESPLAFTCYGP